jgi:hypothetical protein
MLRVREQEKESNPWEHQQDLIEKLRPLKCTADRQNVKAPFFMTWLCVTNQNHRTSITWSETTEWRREEKFNWVYHHFMVIERIIGLLMSRSFILNGEKITRKILWMDTRDGIILWALKHANDKIWAHNERTTLRF